MTFHFKLTSAEQTQDASALVNFHQELGVKPIEIHTMLARLIDPLFWES